ncbi:MAG: hypothetical protein KAX15_04545 [Candidatus Omnitrophica bacterium]|nr:hypothetical protein [Candidatus Omnitrophota bacterium]
MAKKMYGSLVKADVDISRSIMIVNMGMHADGEAKLLEDGSKQDDLWGINLHPDDYGTDDFIEFDSMINIRPRQNNFSRDVQALDIRKKIINIVESRVYE